MNNECSPYYVSTVPSEQKKSVDKQAQRRIRTKLIKHTLVHQQTNISYFSRFSHI